MLRENETQKAPRALQKTEKSGVFNKLSIILVVCSMTAMALQASNNGFASVAFNFTDYYNKDFTAISLLGTIVFITALPANFLASTFIKKVGLKTCCIIAPAGIIIFGTLPAFIPLSYEFLLLVRACFGLFYGLGMPLGLTVAAWYFNDENQRASVIGWAMALVNVFNIALSVGAANLAQVNLPLFWMVHFIIVIPLVFAFVMPDPRKIRERNLDNQSPNCCKDEEAPNAAAVSNKITSVAWFYIAIFILLNFFAAAFMVNISTIVQGEGIGSAVDSSILFSIQSVAGMFIGLMFGALNIRLKNYFPVFTVACFVVAFTAFSFGENLTVFFICAPFFGIGYIGTISWCNTMITASVSPEKTALAVGIANAGSFISMFIYNFVISGITEIFGVVGNNRFAFYLSLIFYTALLLLMLGRALKKPAAA